jgi:hypothetical protein
MLRAGSSATGLMGSGSLGGAAMSGSFKKTGVIVTKTFQMLCGRCGKRFAKIMIVELTADNEGMTAFEIQSLFNTSQSK